MLATRLTRRASLLLPFLLAACGGEEPQNFPPLRYTYLPPIRLNVAGVSIQQQFYPSGMAPDITDRDPVHPVEALRAMAEDRLQALGSSGQAVFSITNAALTREGDVITCGLAVTLGIYPSPGIRSGFVEAVVSRQHVGSVDDLPTTLYDITKQTMRVMNVEFEYQIRRNLQPWLVSSSAMQPPVQQQPLTASPLGAPGTAPAQPMGQPMAQPMPGAPPGAPYALN